MTNASDLAALKQRNDELYQRVITLQREDVLERDTGERNRLNRRVGDLLEALQSVPTEAMTSEDYGWLSDTLLKWQILSTATLKKPRVIEVPPPPKTPSGRATGARLSKDEVDMILNEKALHQSRIRRAQHLVEELEKVTSKDYGNQDDHRRDWHLGTVQFALEVLQGQPPMWRLTSPSYVHLGNVWLDEVKILWAYFDWKRRGSPVWAETQADYCAACDEIDQRIFARRESPAPLEACEEMKLYLEKELLTEGKIPCPPAGKAKELIEAKAGRLSRLRPAPSTGEERSQAEREDWLTAEKFVQDFYEGMVQALAPPAPDETEPSAREEGVQRALGAVRREAIVSAFEAGLAMCYLPK